MALVVEKKWYDPQPVAVSKEDLEKAELDLTDDALRQAISDLQSRMDDLFATAVKTYEMERGPLDIKKLKGGKLRLTLTATLTPTQLTAAQLPESKGPQWG